MRDWSGYSMILRECECEREMSECECEMSVCECEMSVCEMMRMSVEGK